MKKIFYILSLFLATSLVSFAQDEGDEGGGKLREKMIEYIKNKLSLSKEEAERFQPILLDYLKQLKSTRDQYKGDKILLQQKIAELRLRTRDQFKPIMGEKRSNEVFEHMDGFIKEARQELKERQNERRHGRANNKTRALLQ